MCKIHRKVCANKKKRFICVYVVSVGFCIFLIISKHFIWITYRNVRALIAMASNQWGRELSRFSLPIFLGPYLKSDSIWTKTKFWSLKWKFFSIRSSERIKGLIFIGAVYTLADSGGWGWIAICCASCTLLPVHADSWGHLHLCLKKI